MGQRTTVKVTLKCSEIKLEKGRLVKKIARLQPYSCVLA